MMENTNENYRPSKFRRTKNLALVITTSAALAFAGCSPEYKDAPKVEVRQPLAGAETFYPANTNAEVQLEDFTPVDSLEYKTNEVSGIVSTNAIAQNYGRTTNSTRSGGSVLPLLMHNRTLHNSGSSQGSSYGPGLKSDYGSSVRNTYDAAPAAEHSAVTKSSSASSGADADGSSVSKGSSTASKSTVTRGGFGSSGSHHAGGTGS